MSDTVLRELERQWLASRDPRDGLAYYKALARNQSTGCPACGCPDTFIELSAEFPWCSATGFEKPAKPGIFGPPKTCCACGIAYKPDAAAETAKRLELHLEHVATQRSSSLTSQRVERDILNTRRTVEGIRCEGRLSYFPILPGTLLLHDNAHAVAYDHGGNIMEYDHGGRNIGTIDYATGEWSLSMDANIGGGHLASYSYNPVGDSNE